MYQEPSTVTRAKQNVNTGFTSPRDLEVRNDIGTLMTSRIIEATSRESHKKHKSKKRKHEQGGSSLAGDNDGDLRGGWCAVATIEEVSGSVAVQMGDSPMYIQALDNGLFTVGAPHDEGDGPSPEEILTAIPVGAGKIALKSGYGKYLGVEKSEKIVGRADAIGPMEQWEPVFQEGKTALLAANDCFVGLDDEDNVVAHAKTAGPGEMVTIRTNAIKDSDKPKEVPEEEQGKVKDIEINYVKKFQKFQDKKMRLNDEDVSYLKRAKKEGDLHETMLDRRAKMKADRYCK
ncbi:FSHD region gene 1 [Oratosquilla oratoria]|uniref:FSHD region gene 1 n=1 Tax=Oratosquilla oratoria TaxID=337810 RepID=UPI003F76A754